MSRKEIPITGVAICNALGSGWDANTRALRDGASGLIPSTVPVPFETYTGTITTPLEDLTGRLAGWQTRSAQLAAHMLTQMEGPLERARQRYAPHRIAVLLGTSTAGADATEAAYKTFIEQGALPEGYDLWRHHTYGALLHVVRELTGATGPSWMVSTACTSSAKVIASAQRLIDSDIVDAAIVGGIDTLCAMTLSGFYSLGALSGTPCRPFSGERKGINIGEGGAFLLMERDGEAQALLEGVGESSDAYHISAPHPEGLGAQAAMKTALAQAGIDASAVDHINAHGTGTRLNDSAEAKAIHAVFGDEVPVVSTKGYTGHTLGGAGATEAAFAMIALREQFIPAGLGLDPKDEAISIHTPSVRIDGAVRRVLRNSFAFGGNNISILMRAV